MSKNVLKRLIKELMTEAPSDDDQKQRPVAVGVTPRGKSPRSWGGKRVYDKKTKESFDVVKFVPEDPDDEVQHVILQSREKGKKRIKVSYNEYLGDYLRHSGDPVKTKIDDLHHGIKWWAKEELEKQQGEPVSPGSYSDGPPQARGAVDVDPETGEYVRSPSTKYIDSPSERFESEVALDKHALVASNEEAYHRLLVPYMDRYIDHLARSLQIAQKAIKEYLKDIVRTGELDSDEMSWLKSQKPKTIFAAIWELPNFHNHILSELGIHPQHISSISSIASATGALSIADMKSDDATKKAIVNDPGFKTWLSKVDSGAFWNKLRREAESAGTYRGQM